MNDRPNDIEELLRSAMRAHTERAHPAAGLARKALRGAARVRRVQYAATAAASVAAVGAVTATGFALQTSPRGGSTPTLAEGPPSPSESCYNTASAVPSAKMTGPAGTAGSSTRTSSATTGDLDSPASGAPSQEIEAVKLADPAPFYALRRGDDALTPTGFGASSTYWTATYLLAQKPGVQHTFAKGGVEVDPAGPEATVLVIDGHPFDLDNPTTLEGVPVSGRTTVLGHQAWVTSACDQTDIVFSTGRFQVLLAGFPGGGTATSETNIARLEEVAAGLSGLQ